ncbi:HNH endonuclease [Acidimicrobiia bacterium EGI L10123]|uniref:HNH endonuclease signature motif containing protein n=1 Tax=Salinilacustrithrix flava TaxID=2957203 RepID=UPI003D7C3503|nr:HNH endonuclease [Acidimicrobiia bacterium EGI L10123]
MTVAPVGCLTPTTSSARRSQQGGGQVGDDSGELASGFGNWAGDPCQKFELEFAVADQACVQPLFRFLTRFLSYVETRDQGCWVWKGALDHNGYGRIHAWKGKKPLAHRVAYTLWNGPIPPSTRRCAEEMVVHHTCHQRACVNPAHLTLLTRRDNAGRHRHTA